GFVAFGPARPDRGQPTRIEGGEIYGLYVRQALWGAGLGHRLFRAAGDHLRRHGATALHLWVLAGNHRAQSAYRRWGGRLDPALAYDDSIGGHPVRHIPVIFEAF